jgi:pimeloyl-ACP methyl ester carboxylesterase
LDRPRPVELARSVRVPTLIVHGSDDAIAPADEVQSLAAAIPARPEMVEVAGARHADVFEVGGVGLADRVASFLEGAR